MSEIKVISAPKIAEGNLKKGDSLFVDLEEKVNKFIAEGWQVVGPGPEREVVILSGKIVEILRKIPVVNKLINFLFPLELKLVMSVIIKKD
ncbi:hypothetical protein N9A28_02860 [Sulfurimonas sp.]|nr:hypothetical protein [Sulfurimonas sp.]